MPFSASTAKDILAIFTSRMPRHRCHFEVKTKDRKANARGFFEFNPCSRGFDELIKRWSFLWEANKRRPFAAFITAFEKCFRALKINLPLLLRLPVAADENRLFWLIFSIASLVGFVTVYGVCRTGQFSHALISASANVPWLLTSKGQVSLSITSLMSPPKDIMLPPIQATAQRLKSLIKEVGT